MTIQKINDILATERRDGIYDALIELENDLREGRQHFYLRGTILEVETWFDCFISYEFNNNTEKYELYYSIEGKTVSGKYFNIKSTDYIARRITIK